MPCPYRSAANIHTILLAKKSHLYYHMICNMGSLTSDPICQKWTGP